jgi:putative transposase
MDKFRGTYRIPSARWAAWDYGSNAAYFVTICAAEGRHDFGEIGDAEMQLSLLGQAARDCWLAIPDHFPFVLLGASVVMPNHVHGIIIISRPTAPVETQYVASPAETRNPATPVETQNLASPMRTRNPASPV